MKKVITSHQYVAEVRDEFYFSSLPGYSAGEQPQIGEAVAVFSQGTGNLLALGQIEKQGEPYAECSIVRIVRRFL